MHCLRQGASASGVHRPDDLGGLRGRATQARELLPYAGRLDGFHAVPASAPRPVRWASTTTSTRLTASAVGRPIEVQAYADRIVIRQDGRIVAKHPRSFGRGETPISNAKRTTLPSVSSTVRPLFSAVALTASRSRTASRSPRRRGSRSRPPVWPSPMAR
jgi:hypothetical protein